MGTVTFDVDGAGDFSPSISTSGATSVNWDWGDSTSDTGDNPTKNYATAGTRTVVLTVLPDTALSQFKVHNQPLMKTLPVFVNTPNVNTLFAYGNSSMTGDIADLAVLANMANLRLFNTSVSGDVGALATMTGITTLFIANANISGSIEDLSGLLSLSVLRLYGTSVTGDVDKLSALTNIAYLELYSSNVGGDIAGLSGMTNMSVLFLFGTNVYGDIGALSTLTKITSLRVNSTTVSAQNLNTVKDIYTARADFVSNVNLRIESNAPLSGSYTAPPANGVSNGNWQWDAVNAKHHPLTGYAAIYALSNDPNAESFKTWTVTYDPAEDPVLTAPADISDQHSESYSFSVVTTNPGANSLIFSASGLPPGISIDSETGVISGTTAANDNSYTPIVTVDDGFGGTDNDTFDWVVTTGTFAASLANADVVAENGILVVESVEIFVVNATSADIVMTAGPVPVPTKQPIVASDLLFYELDQQYVA